MEGVADSSHCLCVAQLPSQFMVYFHKRGIIPKTFSSDLVQQTKAHPARARSNEQ
jgi:hypothetical protein